MSAQNQQAGSPDPRRGILGRVTAVVYWLVVVEVAFLLAALPGFVGMLFLEPVAANIPLYALCLLPFGPAFSAALGAMRARERDVDGELDPWPRFWRAWAGNLRDVLLLWVPALVVLSVLGFNIAFAGPVGTPFVIISIVLAVLVALWVVHVLVIVSLFRFRTRDAARLGVYFLAAKPLVTLGVLSFLVLCVAFVFLVSPWALPFLGSVLAALLLVNARPMTKSIEARFVEGAEGAEDAAA